MSYVSSDLSFTLRGRLSVIAKQICYSKEIILGDIMQGVCRVCVFAGRPVMIVVEYMENGSLDSFLRVSVEVIRELIYDYCMSVSCLRWYFCGK